MAAKKKATAKPKAVGKKAPEAKPAAAKAAPKIFNNDDPEAKALFLQHLPKIKALKNKANSATSDLRNGYKAAKAHGFDKADFDYAAKLETAEAEAKTRAQIARNLVIARFMGSDLGAQLDLFLAPDRTPAADRAYHEGQTASMSNTAAIPSYAPETEQYRQYMAGFHDHQASIAKGIKPTAKPKKDKTNGEAKADKPEDAKVTSGVPMSRAEFEAQQKQEHESHFQKA